MKVAAVYEVSLDENALGLRCVLTDAVSHAGRPTFFEAALFAMRSYTDRMCFGAGVVFGLA